MSPPTHSVKFSQCSQCKEVGKEQCGEVERNGTRRQLHHSGQPWCLCLTFNPSGCNRSKFLLTCMKTNFNTVLYFFILNALLVEFDIFSHFSNLLCRCEINVECSPQNSSHIFQPSRVPTRLAWPQSILLEVYAFSGIGFKSPGWLIETSHSGDAWGASLHAHAQPTEPRLPEPLFSKRAWPWDKDAHTFYTHK